MKFCSVCHSCYDDEALCCNSDDHPLLIPSRIGRCDEVRGYLIENLLSLDTRSELYRARHLASGRSCLIKFIGSNSALAEQFLRDAETATTLIRANIADVYEAGRTSGVVDARVIDWNGDGRPDVVVVEPSSLSWWENAR